MFRKTLAKNRGMIFVYNKPEEMNFWMRNTVLPLSIAYVHEKLFIASIHDMKPLDLNVVSSDVPVLYAIEVNQGWFSRITPSIRAIELPSTRSPMITKLSARTNTAKKLRCPD